MAPRQVKDEIVEQAPVEEIVTPIEGEVPAVPVDDEQVEIWHPDTPGLDTAISTRGAYRETWAAKGFRIVARSERDADGTLRYVLEAPLAQIDEVPEEDDSSGDGEPETTGDTPDASSQHGSESETA